MDLGNFRHGDNGVVICCPQQRSTPRLDRLGFGNLSDPSRCVLLRGDHDTAFGQRLHCSVLVVCRCLSGLDQLLRICVSFGDRMLGLNCQRWTRLNPLTIPSPAKTEKESLLRLLLYANWLLKIEFPERYWKRHSRTDFPCKYTC